MRPFKKNRWNNNKKETGPSFLTSYVALLRQGLDKLINTLPDTHLPVNIHLPLDGCHCTTYCQVSFTVEKTADIFKGCPISAASGGRDFFCLIDAGSCPSFQLGAEQGDSLQDPRCGTRLSSAAFSCTIYQLKRDEMSSEAASAKVSTQFGGLFRL